AGVALSGVFEALGLSHYLACDLGGSRHDAFLSSLGASADAALVPSGESAGPAVFSPDPAAERRAERHDGASCTVAPWLRRRRASTPRALVRGRELVTGARHERRARR